MDEWVRVSKAAQMLGLSAARVVQLVDSGALKGRRGVYGREVNAEALANLIQERKAQ